MLSWTPVSHGGSDPGAVGSTGFQEKDFTLPVVLSVGELLESVGLQVIYTRTTDTYVSLDQRCKTANAAHAQVKVDLFLSVHANSASDPTAHGTETWCYQFGGEGEKAAKAIQAQMVKSLGLTDRGVKASGSKIYVLKYTDMPAALAEVAFISNLREEAQLRTGNFQAEAARAIADGVLAYFGFLPATKPASQPTESQKAWTKATAKGILDGTNPQGGVTREQLAVVLDRLKLL